jgi:hypothetical protein
MALPESSVSADGSIEVHYRDSDHSYRIVKPELGRVVSVTGVISAYDKPALVGAAANVTLDGVAALHKMASDCSPFSDSRALADALYKRELRHWQVWKKAGDRGTFVHAILQAWIEDGRVPTTDDVPDGYREYVRAFGNFVAAHQPESITSEVIVASARHSYAGRYDWVARLTVECDVADCGCHRIAEGAGASGVAMNGATVRIDHKTSKGLYPENMAQLDLYEVAAVEMGEDQADYRAPLRLGKDGSYEFQVSLLPVGASLPLVGGYRARKQVEELHGFLNPRKGRK